MDVTPQEAVELKKKEGDGLVILDVRTPGEFRQGHIPDALNVDYHGSDFNGRIGGLDKTKAYLVHCQSGHRSSNAVKLMTELGFKTIYHLADGFAGWAEESLPIE